MSWPNVNCIAGRATNDVQIRTTESGKTYAAFRLANPRGRNEANFITVECWGKVIPKALERVAKGKTVIVTGELRHYENEGPNGERTHRYTIRAHDVHGFTHLIKHDEVHETEIIEAAEIDADDELAA